MAVGYAEILRRLRSSPLTSLVKRFLPERIKLVLLSTLARGREGTLELDDGALFAYPLEDFYWSRLKDIQEYEPEVWFILKATLNPGVLFIDCGANIGLWSSYAAAIIGNPNQVIAVEPGEAVLPALMNNCRLNRHGFRVISKAIWDHSGEVLDFFEYGLAHASASVIPSPERSPSRRLRVETICIDDIVGQFQPLNADVRDIIIKIDVEGAERQALEGARRTMMARNLLLIFEDHGQDETSETSAHYRSLGLNTYYWDGATRRMHRIEDSSQAKAVKEEASRGYNFFACRPGSAFDEKLRGLCV